MSSDNSDIKPFALLFQAFANPLRMEILRTLDSKGSMNVTEIGEKLGLEQTSVSHNLRCLAFCGLVAMERRGKSRVYSLNKETVLPMLRVAEAHLREHGDNLLNCDVLER